MRRWLAVVGMGLVACGASATGPLVQEGPRKPSVEAPATLELVESWPAETTLDHADVADAAETWVAMIDGARKTLDFAEFYASEADEAHLATSKLRPVVEAIARASARGVRVRFLVDASFATKYPDTLAALAKARAEVRRYDVGRIMGGVLHAKYFVVDRREVFVGSQNFDWRALGHIQEMGVRYAGDASAPLVSVFEADWAEAAGEEVAWGPEPPKMPPFANGVGFAASPIGFLPAAVAWDLPMLVGQISAARKTLAVQLLTYATHNRDGSRFTVLDEALRAAAARGVAVRLLVSHWAAKPGGHAREALEALATVPGISVKVITIPPWSGGEIPFARVAHAKYAVFDGERAWVGTSNWEGDYFLRSRNVSAFLDRGAVPRRLAGIFEDGWSSAYTAELTAGASPARAPTTSGAPPSSTGPARR